MYIINHIYIIIIIQMSETSEWKHQFMQLLFVTSRGRSTKTVCLRSELNTTTHPTCAHYIGSYSVSLCSLSSELCSVVRRVLSRVQAWSEQKEKRWGESGWVNGGWRFELLGARSDDRVKNQLTTSLVHSEVKTWTRERTHSLTLREFKPFISTWSTDPEMDKQKGEFPHQGWGFLIYYHKHTIKTLFTPLMPFVTWIRGDVRWDVVKLKGSVKTGEHVQFITTLTKSENFCRGV